MRRSRSPLARFAQPPSVTPSLTSDSDGRSNHSISPSKVTKNPDLFTAWLCDANVFPESAATSDVLKHFENLYRLEALPLPLSQEIIQEPGWRDEADFCTTIRQWASSLGATEEDKYGVFRHLHFLAFVHSQIKQTANNNAKEHEQRRGIDNLFEAAFTTRFDRFCNVRTETAYRLVGLDNNPNTCADTLVTITSESITRKVLKHRYSLDEVARIQMHWSSSVQNEFSIIGFAGEFKDDPSNNQNQLFMVLKTAQSQRRALRLKNSIIMGATGCRGIVKIYSSYWGDRKNDPLLYIYEHKEQFNLTDPTHVIHLYLFLSNLQEDLQRTFASELQGWEPPSQEAIKDRTWRTHNKKRRRINEDGKSASNNNRGIGGLDDDKATIIMKWCEGVWDANRVMAFSGEGEILSVLA